MSLTQTQLNAFLSMAGTNSDEFTAMEQTMAGLPDEIRAALTELDTDSKKEAAKITAKVIFEAFKAADQKVLLQVEEIRAARRREASAQHNIKQMQMAKAYAAETGNYIPLLALNGEISYSAASDMRSNGVKTMVPADWQPKAPPAKAVMRKKAV